MGDPRQVQGGVRRCDCWQPWTYILRAERQHRNRSGSVRHPRVNRKQRDLSSTQAREVLRIKLIRNVCFFQTALWYAPGSRRVGGPSTANLDYWQLCRENVGERSASCSTPIDPSAVRQSLAEALGPWRLIGLPSLSDSTLQKRYPRSTAVARLASPIAASRTYGLRLLPIWSRQLTPAEANSRSLREAHGCVGEGPERRSSRLWSRSGTDDSHGTCQGRWQYCLLFQDIQRHLHPIPAPATEFRSHNEVRRS